LTLIPESFVFLLPYPIREGGGVHPEIAFLLTGGWGSFAHVLPERSPSCTDPFEGSGRLSEEGTKLDSVSY